MPCETQPCCSPELLDLLPSEMSLRVTWPSATCPIAATAFIIKRRQDKILLGVNGTTRSLSYSTDEFQGSCGRSYKFEIEEDLSTINSMTSKAVLRLHVIERKKTRKTVSWNIHWGVALAMKNDLPAGSTYQFSVSGNPAPLTASYSSGLNGLASSIIATGASTLAKAFNVESHPGWDIGSLVVPEVNVATLVNPINDLSFVTGNWTGAQHKSGMIISFGTTKYGNGGWFAKKIDFIRRGPALRSYEQPYEYLAKSRFNAFVLSRRVDPQVQGELLGFSYVVGPTNCDDCRHSGIGIAWGVDEIVEVEDPNGVYDLTFDPALLHAEVSVDSVFVPNEIASLPYSGAGDCSAIFKPPVTYKVSDGSQVPGYPDGPGFWSHMLSLDGRPRKTLSGASAAVGLETNSVRDILQDLHTGKATMRSTLLAEVLIDVTDDPTRVKEWSCWMSDDPVDMNSPDQSTASWIGSFKYHGDPTEFKFNDQATITKEGCKYVFRNCPGSNLIADIVPASSAPIFPMPCTLDADNPAIKEDNVQIIGGSPPGIVVTPVITVIPISNGVVPAPNPRIVFPRTKNPIGSIYGTTGTDFSASPASPNSIQNLQFKPHADVQTSFTGVMGSEVRYYPIENTIAYSGHPFHYGSFSAHYPGIIVGNFYGCGRLTVVDTGSPSDYELHEVISVTHDPRDMPWTNIPIPVQKGPGRGKTATPLAPDLVPWHGLNFGNMGADCDRTNVPDPNYVCTPIFDRYRSNGSPWWGLDPNPAITGVRPGRPRDFQYSEMKISRSSIAFDPSTGSVSMTVTYTVLTYLAKPYSRSISYDITGRFENEPQQTPDHPLQSFTINARSYFMYGFVELRKAVYRSQPGVVVDECLRPNADRSRSIDLDFVSDAPANFKDEKVTMPGSGAPVGGFFDSERLEMVFNRPQVPVNDFLKPTPSIVTLMAATPSYGKISDAAYQGFILYMTGGYIAPGSHPASLPFNGDTSKYTVTACSYSPPAYVHPDSLPTPVLLDFSATKVTLSLGPEIQGPYQFGSTMTYSLPATFPIGIGGTHTLVPDQHDSHWVEEVVGPPYLRSMLVAGSWVLNIFDADLTRPQARRVVARYALPCTPKSRFNHNGDTTLQLVSGDKSFADWPFYLKVTSS